jgi:hypothetical protein
MSSLSTKMHYHETSTKAQDHSMGYKPAYSGLTTSESSTALTPLSATSNPYSTKSLARSRSSRNTSRAAMCPCRSSIDDDGGLCYPLWMLDRYLNEKTSLEGLFTTLTLDQPPWRNSESQGTLQQTTLVEGHDVTGECGVSCQLELELDEFFEKCGGSLVEDKGHPIPSDYECILSSFREGMTSR